MTDSEETNASEGHVSRRQFIRAGGAVAAALTALLGLKGGSEVLSEKRRDSAYGGSPYGGRKG